MLKRHEAACVATVIAFSVFVAASERLLHPALPPDVGQFAMVFVVVASGPFAWIWWHGCPAFLDQSLGCGGASRGEWPWFPFCCTIIALLPFLYRVVSGRRSPPSFIAGTLLWIVFGALWGVLIWI